ncbi:MAG: PD-(D/E)XK nuclease-like domain-containing protein [Geminicoccaceae bacterium]
MPTEITEPGIYDIPSAAYHALPHLSRSTIHTLLTKSPAHAKMVHQEESNGAMRLGTVWHKLVLGKGDEYAVSPYDEYRTNEAKAWRDEQVEAGLVPIKRKEFDIAQEMADRLLEQISNHEIGNVFDRPGRAEVATIWQDDGVWCRALMDWLPEDVTAIYDLKSSESASTDAFQRVAFAHGYHLQAHWYARGVAAAMSHRHKLDHDLDPALIPFRFIVQESSPPHFVNVIEMSGEALFMAEEQIEKALRIWKQCTKSGKWPGYGHKVREIDPPGYMISRWEMEKSVDALNQYDGVAA